MSDSHDIPHQGDSDLNEMEASILVLSEDFRLRDTLSVNWPDFPCRVLYCATIEEATPTLLGADLDLALVQWDSDPGKAFEMARSLKDSGVSAPVYIIRAEYTVADHLECIRIGAEGFLGFPPDRGRLVELVGVNRAKKREVSPRVLLVDDDPLFLRITSALLSRNGFQTEVCADPMALFDALSASRPDVVVMDFEMPHANGAELCRMIRNVQEYHLLPVVILTASTDPTVRKRCLEAGADDFIRKPVDSGDFIPRLQAKVIRGDMLRSMANLDPLTQLYTARAFREMVSREIARSQRHGRAFTIAILDVDHFSAVNQQHSFAVGDEVLRKLSLFFRERFRKSDILGRSGGDEFGVLLSELEVETAKQLMAGILEAASLLDVQTGHSGSPLKISFCCGLAGFPRHGKTPQSLLSSAVSALLQAKKAGPKSIVAHALPGENPPGPRTNRP